MNFGFKSLHPAAALLFFIFAFVFSLSSTNPYFLTVSFLCAALFSFRLRGKRAAGYLFKVVLPMILLITVFNGLFSHYGVTVLFTARNGNNLTLEALVYGFVSGVKIADVLLWLDCFNEIIDADKTVYLFGRFSPSFALVFSMVMRFIPLIRRQAAEINRAQKAIGCSAEGKSVFRKLSLAGRRLSILVSWTLERGLDTAFSMQARGYGLPKRSAYSKYIFSALDLAVTFGSTAALFLFILTASHFRSGYNPVISVPSPDASLLAALTGFAFMLLSPIVIDFTEEKRWSISA